MCDRLQTKEDWFPLLNWKRLPNFGLVHTLSDFGEIKKNYFVPAELSRLLDNFLIGLRGEKSLYNFLIKGKPGIGKTSFVYFLKKLLEIEPDSVKGGARFLIHITHIESVKESGEVKESLLLKEMLGALNDYFESVSLGSKAVEINQREISDKEKIRNFVYFIKKQKEKFNKTLIFILDDVDNASDEQILTAAETLYNDLEVVSVKKWLVIQDISLNAKFSKKTRDFVQRFYPDERLFPDIDLYDIIDYRIRALGKNALNPFSKELCRSVQDLQFGHMRQSLSRLENMLEVIGPKDFKPGTEIRVIRKYLEVSSLNFFLKSNILPNIHDSIYRATTFFPTIYEVLNVIKYIRKIDAFFVSIVNDVLQAKLSLIKNYRDSRLQIRVSEINDTIKWLIDNNLVDELDNERVILSSRGKYLVSVIRTKLYTKITKKLISDNLGTSFYWDIVKTNVDYQGICLSKLDWREFRD